MKPATGSVVYHQFLLSKLVGGAALVALELARTLEKQGRSVRIWLPGPGPALVAARELGLPVQLYRLPMLQSRYKPVAAVMNWWISSRLRSFGRGLVHVHSPYLYGLLRWGLRRTDLRTVVHVHIEEEEEGMRWAFRQPPNLIITCAKFLIPQVHKVLPAAVSDRPSIVHIPNAVDTEKFHPGDRRQHKIQLGLDPGVPLVLMLANLAPHKGQETAIRTVAALKRRGRRCRLWLAGSERNSGGYTRILEELIAREAVGDCVNLVGQRDDASNLLRAADFLVLPSRHEGLPLCILEAQASKVPVIAAATCGIPEVIVDGETGFLIPPEDAEGYADRIDSLLVDPAAATRLVDRAYSRVTEKNEWRAYVAAVLERYEELLEGHPTMERKP